MKKIEAIVRPERLDAIKDALEKGSLPGLTVTHVSGRGRQKGVALQWRAGEYRVDLLPKVKLELIIADDECPKAIDIICRSAQTGHEGDGMIFILPVENAIRVRTGDFGEGCLSQ